MNEALRHLSNYVRGGFAGGMPHMTLADIALMASYSTLRATKLVDHKSNWYVEAWFKRCKSLVSGGWWWSLLRKCVINRVMFSDSSLRKVRRQRS